MTEMQKKKVDPVMEANLRSLNEEMVLNTLNDLRISGSAVYLPVLAEILLYTKSEDVRKSVLSIFGELKDKDSVQLLIDTIENPVYLPVRKDLIAACWQNGLDYSPYLSKLVDWVIDSEMDIAFEAFTVIENLDHFPEVSARETEIVKINHALQKADALKSYLLRELRGILA
jgi:HEAT repeat protein